jgi:RING-box protein 1
MTSKFTINSAKLLATWGYNIPVSDCIICRSNINLPSLNHQDKGKVSAVSIGFCGHAFHEDCIIMWSVNHPHCPICAETWRVINYIY